MNIRTRTKIVIFSVSLTISIVSAMCMFLVLKHQAESTIAKLAEQESWRVHDQLVQILENKENTDRNNLAVNTLNQMVGGMFDWIELHQSSGLKIAEVSTDKGRQLEKTIASHQKFDLQKPGAFIDASSSSSVLRIFVPIFKKFDNPNSEFVGYLEVGREVPTWRKQQIQDVVIYISAIAAFSALITGLLIYPSIRLLLRRQRENLQKLFESHIQVLDSLGLAVAKRESGTGTHNYKVTWIAAMLGERMGLPSSKIKNLIAGSFLHDVGKIATPDNILLKPGKLTDEEMVIMREHVTHGEDIVKNLGWFSDSINVVSSHHEKWDGSGYPRKLSGENIPIEARIFAVADVFDALCSKRPYKDEIDFLEAMNYIRTQSGSHFDPTIVAQFEEIASLMYEKTHGVSESEAKSLLQPMINKYFSINLIENE